MKVWRAVKILALFKLRPMVLAALPLYVPENVREASVAERLARLAPRATPEMVEFWSWLLPMVEVETTEPLLFTARRVLARPERARLVVVALVVVALVRRTSLKVEEAEEIRPLVKAMVVEVAFSPVPNFTNG